MRSGGKKRHYIQIQRPSDIDDGQGGITRSWDSRTGSFIVWEGFARIRPLNARERFYTGKEEQQTTHRIEIDFAEEVKPKYRILFGDRILHIDGIRNIDEGNHELQLMCSELAS